MLMNKLTVSTLLLTPVETEVASKVDAAARVNDETDTGERRRCCHLLCSCLKLFAAWKVALYNT